MSRPSVKSGQLWISKEKFVGFDFNSQPPAICFPETSIFMIISDRRSRLDKGYGWVRVLLEQKIVLIMNNDHQNWDNRFTLVRTNDTNDEPGRFCESPKQPKRLE